MINNYKNTFEHLLNFINFIVRYFKYISVFFILSFLSIGSIYFYFNKKEIIYNHEWSIDIDYNIEYFVKELKRAKTIDLNIASEKLLDSLDMSNYYIDSSGYLYKSKNSNFNFSENILKQINNNSNVYPLTLVRHNLKKILNRSFFKKMIMSNLKNQSVQDLDYKIDIKFIDNNESLRYLVKINNTTLPYDDLSGIVKKVVLLEVVKVLRKYIETYGDSIIDDKKNTELRYIESNKDWLNYYEKILIKKIAFLEKQERIALEVEKDKTRANMISSKDFINENFLGHYYFSEPIRIEKANLLKILSDKKFDKYLPHFSVYEIYLKSLDIVEQNIKSKIVEFNFTLNNYINITVSRFSDSLEKNSFSLLLFIFIGILINLIFIMFCLLRSFYMMNKERF